MDVVYFAGLYEQCGAGETHYTKPADALRAALERAPGDLALPGGRRWGIDKHLVGRCRLPV